MTTRPKKWLALSFLKFQGNNQQNASTITSAKGKLEKKAVFSPCCGDETTTCHDTEPWKIIEKVNVSHAKIS